MRGTWQTTDFGGGGAGLGTALLVIVGAALFVKATPVALAGAAALLHLVLIVAAVILGLAAVAVAGFVAWRLYRWRHPGADRATALPPGMERAAHPLTEPRRSAAALPPRDRPREIHLHLHGVSAEDVAAILARRNGQDHG
jgi:hypothetical protein